MTDPRPIEKLVKRYLCPFCRRGRSTYAQIANHMHSCVRNPAAQRCLTCEHFFEAEKPEYDWNYGGMTSPGSPRSCALGISLTEENDTHSHLPINCPSWAPKVGS